MRPLVSRSSAPSQQRTQPPVHWSGLARAHRAKVNSRSALPRPCPRCVHQGRKATTSKSRPPMPVALTRKRAPIQCRRDCEHHSPRQARTQQHCYSGRQAVHARSVIRGNGFSFLLHLRPHAKFALHTQSWRRHGSAASIHRVLGCRGGIEGRGTPLSCSSCRLLACRGRKNGSWRADGALQGACTTSAGAQR